MKKIGYIGILIGIIFLINAESKAQHYYTSYGAAHQWQIPKNIHHSIYDNYYGYEIAHVRHFRKHGHQHFNVLMHRNGWFVELRLDHRGRIYKTKRHRNFNPLISHRCTNHCGYNKVYYQAYYPRYHYHHGYATTVYVKSGHGHHHKNNDYYSNVHIEQPQKHYQKSRQQHNARSSEPRVIKHTQRAEQSRSNTGSGIQRADNRNQLSLNTSRGRTRGEGYSRNERSSRNR